MQDNRRVLTQLNKDFPPCFDPADPASRALSDDDPAFAQNWFTPGTLINPTDAIHPGLDYGLLVLQQLADRLTDGQRPGYRGIVTGAAG